MHSIATNGKSSLQSSFVSANVPKEFTFMTTIRPLPYPANYLGSEQSP